MHELVEFEARNLYSDAITQIALVLLQKTRVPVACRYVWIRQHSSARSSLESLLNKGAPVSGGCSITELSPTACRSANWILDSTERQSTIARIVSAGRALAEHPLQIRQGIVTGDDSTFLVHCARRYDDGLTLVEARDGAQHLVETAILRPILRDRDVKAFASPTPRSFCITPLQVDGTVIPEEILRATYPRTFSYLTRRREFLEQRARPSTRPWYAFRSSSTNTIASPRILLKRVTSGGDFTLDRDASCLCHGSVPSIVLTSAELDPLILLGILNSSVFWTFVSSRMSTMGEGRYALRINELLKFTIPNTALQPSPRHREFVAVVSSLVAGELESSARHDAIELIDRVVADMYGVPINSLALPPRRIR